MAEILIIAPDGRVRAWTMAAGGGMLAETPVGELTLPHAERTLLALARPGGGDGPFALIAATPDGVRAYRWIGRAAGFAAEGELLSSRARFDLRTGVPRFADICQDVNRDGRPDLVIPAGEACELWLDQGGEDGPDLLRTARIPVRVSQWAATDASKLSDVLQAHFAIPRIATEDVNGDGRPDLVVLEGDKRSFHLQDEEGGFPLEPDAVLDLDLFRDTTPAASLRPGRTLVRGDDASVESRDLDGDGAVDFVIAHRRKVWVFHGTSEGPQFTEPTMVFKTAQDITGLALLHLDEDEYPDLLIYKIQVPSIAAMLLGMFKSWDVDITALGYRSREGGKFGILPRDEGVVVLRMPPLLDILKRPEDLLDRLDAASRKFRASIRGDFNGDGVEDVALIGEEAERIDLWLTDPEQALAGSAEDDDALIRAMLFEQSDPIWGLDRVLAWLAAFGERRTAELTGDREPDATITLGEGTGLPLVGAIAADVDGDGRDEVVTVFLSYDGRMAVDVIALAP
ncbi:MAG: VCBS repeat-containing protein [Planctomycetota bacterium]|nr:VCBS repeat-containing protein [Planctomycetota bacterium]